MADWLLSTEAAFTFDIRGRNLLVWCRLLPATSLVLLLDTAKSFIDHIPRSVWSEHGTG